jgi:thermitase
MTTPFNPEDDYPDPRGDQERQVDSLGSGAQSAALTDSGLNPHATINEKIADIRRDRLATAGLVRDDPPILFDVWPDPGSPAGQPDMGIRILVARGEMLLRVPAPGVPAPGVPGPEEAAGPGGDAYTGEGPPPWEQAHNQLLRRGYRQVTPEIPAAAPLRRYVAARTPRELVADRDEIRAATRAELDLNYVVTAGHVVKADDYPRGTAARRRYPPDPVRGREVTVAVIDTGINNHNRTDGWLAGIPETPANKDPLDVFPVRVHNGHVTRGDGLLDPSAGHGSFVTGVVQQVAPAATIRVYRAPDTEGMATSYDVANAMTQAARDGADVINLSLGVSTVDDEAPVAFTTAVETIRSERADVVLVASAGNMGLEVPMYPAAMEEVTGVAALNPDGLTRAIWSNFGDWVDCSSVGVGITSTFVEGYEPHTENGVVVTEYFGPNSWALWSGTSFSAPQIAGAVAQLCQLNDIPPPEALDRLLDGRPELPGRGRVVVILPGK